MNNIPNIVANSHILEWPSPYLWKDIGKAELQRSGGEEVFVDSAGAGVSTNNVVLLVPS
jgi:hypothetical protein